MELLLHISNKRALASETQSGKLDSLMLEKDILCVSKHYKKSQRMLRGVSH
jgi:hypothetical protein